MNVPFTLSDPSNEHKLLTALKENGFSGLKGHKSLGGIRASIYNSLPYESVEALVDFLEMFEK